MPRNKFAYVWQCCSCGTAAINIRVDNCPLCDIVRCRFCQTVRVQLQGGNSVRRTSKKSVSAKACPIPAPRDKHIMPTPVEAKESQDDSELSLEEAPQSLNESAERPPDEEHYVEATSNLQPFPGDSALHVDERLARESYELMQEANECGLALGHVDYEKLQPSLYEVLDYLGHGSLGVVEEVRIPGQPTNLKSFVRKRVQIPYSKRTQYLEIIKQEAQVLQNLSHAHIVQIFGSYSEIGSTSRQFYSLLMAPVGESDLRVFLDMVSESSPHESQYSVWRQWLSKWFACLSSALAYMHRMGVRHQDIKPSNIVYKGSTVYFTDFSSASQFEIGQTTSTESPARTSFMYAAPEVVSNQDTGRHGRGTDVFALGLVFAEMLAVLSGNSVTNYHQILIQLDLHNPSSTTRHSFVYAEMLEPIRKYFESSQLLGFGKIRNDYYAFGRYISERMLAVDRNKRPDAEELANHISTQHILGPCDCG